MDSQETEPQPWDRRPDETSKAFLGFTAYLELGVGRSLVSAYAEYVRRRDGGEPAADDSRARAKTPGYFLAWCRNNDWVERAEAWDDHLHALARSDDETDYLENLKRFRREQLKWAAKASNAAHLLLTKLLRRVRTLDPAEISESELAKLTRAVGDLQQSASVSEQEALGIDRLLEMLDDLDDDR